MNVHNNGLRSRPEQAALAIAPNISTDPYIFGQFYKESVHNTCVALIDCTAVQWSRAERHALLSLCPPADGRPYLGNNGLPALYQALLRETVRAEQLSYAQASNAQVTPETGALWIGERLQMLLDYIDAQHSIVLGRDGPLFGRDVQNIPALDYRCWRAQGVIGGWPQPFIDQVNLIQSDGGQIRFITDAMEPKRAAECLQLWQSCLQDNSGVVGTAFEDFKMRYINRYKDPTFLNGCHTYFEYVYLVNLGIQFDTIDRSGNPRPQLLPNPPSPSPLRQMGPRGQIRLPPIQNPPPPPQRL